MKPQENDRIYDPTCGSGGLLLKAYKKVPSGKVAIYGQELNAQTWALCTMNMFLHGVDDARIWQGDTLSNPQNLKNDQLMRFQVVVANPPFSLDKWDSGFLANAGLDAKGKKQEKMTASMDAYKRFDIGVPQFQGRLCLCAAHAEKSGRQQWQNGSGAAPWSPVPRGQ